MATKRYFEFSEGTSNKFWEVWRDGVQVFTRYGKIGANGQVTVKKLGSDGEAKKLHDKLVNEKTGKGYVEGGGKKAKPAANGKAKAEASDEPDVIVIPEGAVRLEVVEGKSAKFWQIHRNEKTVTVTFGKIGTPGTVQKKKYKDEWDARSDVKKQLEEKKKKGYQYVMAGPRITSPAAAVNPQLESAIVKDRSDDGYLVYGDWLMEQGDPRGALAAIKGTDNKSQNKASALAWKNRQFFYGPWAVFTVENPQEDDAISATWKQGWMDTLRLSATNSWRVDRITVPDCADMVRNIPKVASTRLLRELVIGCPVGESEFTFGNTIKELVKAMPSMPNLRRLVLGDFSYEDSELSWSHLGSLKDFWKVAGKLEYLKIHAGSMDLGKIDAPELRELWIETGGFDKKNAEQIANANAPKLETLNLWFGQDNYGCDLQLKHYASLIEALPKKFPKLKRLGLANCTYGNEVLELLAKSKIVKQVETLDVSKSHITTAGLKALGDNAKAFRHLAVLDLSECLLDSAGKKLAKPLAKKVEVDDQDDPADHQPDPEDPDEDDSWWRYSRVGE